MRIMLHNEIETGVTLFIYIHLKSRSLVGQTLFKSWADYFETL